MNSDVHGELGLKASNKSRFKKTKSIPTILACLFGLISFGFTPSLLGQFVYTPDHPDVKAMCDSALPTLERGGGGGGGGALNALVIVQYHKRYNQRVPTDNRAVNGSIAAILRDFPAAGETAGGILSQQELYYPCLATILLCEYDSVKYKNEIKRMLAMLKGRQKPSGAFTYLNEADTGDTSQTQFAALAMAVAKAHGFNVDVEMAKKTLDWLIATQLPKGNFTYKIRYLGGQPNPVSSTQTMSMHAAGLGSIYLLADVLQLFKRVKKMNKATQAEIGLPPTVSIYVKPIDGEEQQSKKTGPLTSYDRGKLGNATRAGNAYMVQNFKPDFRKWNYYYLYAIERYAYFREQAEGRVNGVDDWYDRTIEYMKTQQQANGSFPRGAAESSVHATAFAILFMVRSSELINLPVSESVLNGGQGFKEDVVIRQGDDGKIRGLEAEKNLGDLLSMLKEGATQEQLQEVSDSLKKQIVEFRKKDDKSRGEIKAFLRSMIGAKNYFKRLIAVRFLAGEQDMDNVPALIYALGDPDFRIAFEAHNGLRLISRKIDSLSLSSSTKTNAVRAPVALSTEDKNNLKIEFANVKQKWTQWFLKIRPGAELLD